MDDAKCFALVRQHRWPEGVRCPGCDGSSVIRDGCDDRQRRRQRYRCKACTSRFDDLTGTVLAGHHQPLRVWVLCLYFMGLNLLCGRPQDSNARLVHGNTVLRCFGQPARKREMGLLFGLSLHVPAVQCRTAGTGRVPLRDEMQRADAVRRRR